LEKKHIWIIVIFFLFIGPGPAMFFLNNYTVTLIPPLCMAALIYLCREDIAEADFNLILKNKNTYKWMYEGLKYGVYAHAINTIALMLLKHPESNNSFTEGMLTQFPAFAIYLVSIGPIFEEMVYRKIIYSGIAKRYSFWTAAIISSLIFAAGHMAPERIFAYFTLGMAMCWIYRRSGSIASPILAHIALNLVAVIASAIR
jgi:uncharacterized protein